MKHMLFLGFGFSARALALQLDRNHWRVTGTSQSDNGVGSISALGFDGVLFDSLNDIPETVTHIVSSVPPDVQGDPVLRHLDQSLARRARQLSWVAYLSTTGVYGDHGGAWIDETTPLTPNTERGKRRVAAESAWQKLHTEHDLPVHIFRLAGIYGPGRNALVSVRDGTAKRIVKSGQVFSRIHVADLAGVLASSLAHPNPGRSYNVADDEPCPPQDVIAYASQLLGVAPPPETAFENAELSGMARSFYADSKRVSNARVKTELGHVFRYPNYRDGLKSLLASLTA